MKRNARRSNGTKATKNRKRLLAEQRPCQICGRGIDYSLAAGDPFAFEVDHVVPVSKGGSLYDWGNQGAAHRYCNGRRGDMDLADAQRLARAGGWWAGLASYGKRRGRKSAVRVTVAERPEPPTWSAEW